MKSNILQLNQLGCKYFITDMYNAITDMYNAITNMYSLLIHLVVTVKILYQIFFFIK